MIRGEDFSKKGESVFATFSRSLGKDQLIYSEPIYFCKSSNVDAIILTGNYDFTNKKLRIDLIETKDSNVFPSLVSAYDTIIGNKLELHFVMKLEDDASKVVSYKTLDSVDMSRPYIFCDVTFKEYDRIQTNPDPIDTKFTPKVCDINVVG